MRRWFSGLILFIGISAYSQNFTIVRMESVPTDLSASSKPRIDLNGQKCGLVKVRCVLDGIKFSGNVIGDIEHKDGEYWVYMTDGSKQLVINHSKVLPLEVDFTTPLQGDIKSGNTYCLTLSIPDALYNSILAQTNMQSFSSERESNIPIETNTTLSGIITDRKDGEPLIGCSVQLKGTGNFTLSNVDGKFTLQNVDPGSTMCITAVGYKAKRITFTGKIPPNYNVTLKEGRGVEKEEYFYDPNDTAEYFDLSGNKLPQRPSKKGVYIRISDGKSEKFTIN